MNDNTDVIATNPLKPVVGRCSQCCTKFSVSIPDIMTSRCANCGRDSHFQAACLHCGQTFFINANAIDTLAPCPHCGKELLLSALLCDDGTKNVVSTTGRLEMHHFALALALAKETDSGANPQSANTRVAPITTATRQGVALKGFSIWLVIGAIQRVLSTIYLLGEVARQYYVVNGQTPERQLCVIAFIVGIVVTWVAYRITNPLHEKLTFYRYILWMLVSGIPMRLVANFISCGITNDTEAFVTNTATHALIYGVLIAVAYAARPKAK